MDEQTDRQTEKERGFTYMCVEERESVCVCVCNTQREESVSVCICKTHIHTHSHTQREREICEHYTLFNNKQGCRREPN